MKRTVPLLITAIGGFVLIVAFFIPVTEGWGEVAAIWFDILAAIAFILGGGNLMKVHLKKISDRQRGWGYSAVVLVSFLAMLYFGLFKVGSKPATKQEHFGEVFAPLALDDLPDSQVAEVGGSVPERGDGKGIPPSSRRQFVAENGTLKFRGWMRPDQRKDLMSHQDELEWQCTIETLAKKAQPPKGLAGKLNYYSDHNALSFRGRMTKAQRETLLKLEEGNDAWKAAVESLHQQSNVRHSVSVERPPEKIRIPEGMNDVSYDADQKTLTITGPMSPGNRDKLARRFPASRPLTGERRSQFLSEIGSLNEKQRAAFDKYLDGHWSADLLIKTLDNAGKAPEEDKKACEMLAEMAKGVARIKPKKKAGKDVALNDSQKGLVRRFADDETMTAEELAKQLKAAGPWEERQGAALTNFLDRATTVGDRNSRLAVALLRVGPLSEEQRSFLTKDYKAEQEWRQTVGGLFVASQTRKYNWSGEYRETGTPFWWLYEYAFKPLTATMFAMLAFYVASAAFRAFRAKNVEAALLLGTAFIILLGRTFAGVVLTSWMPDELEGLRIENMTVTIMTVFNTAGTRAIMIGIALGIASTSLKVLLGVDRSYLGSSEE
jgi:hypothetical protein